MKTSINHIVLFTILFSLQGCLPGMNNISLTSHLKKPNNHHTTSLEYIDSTAFDKSLSYAMNQADAEIIVTVLTPFSSNNVPKRLDSWLTVIKENGGKVNTKPAQGERNVVSLALALYSVYQLIKQQVRYLPAKHYHATLFYRRTASGDALIEKIAFTHK